MKLVRWLWIVLIILSAFCLSADTHMSAFRPVRLPPTTAFIPDSPPYRLYPPKNHVLNTSHYKAFWVQTMDSCQQAIPGASFVLTGNGLSIPAGPALGRGPITIQRKSACPLQRGNCQRVITGCLLWLIPIPSSGTRIYHITETKAPATYALCTGGSVCTGGPEVITLIITSQRTITATVYNVYPDGRSVIWPTTGAPYTGAVTDPAVIHDFGLASGSCDGDNDADDHLTGSPSSYCDNDRDRHR